MECPEAEYLGVRGQEAVLVRRCSLGLGPQKPPAEPVDEQSGQEEPQVRGQQPGDVRRVDCAESGEGTVVTGCNIHFHVSFFILQGSHFPNLPLQYRNVLFGCLSSTFFVMFSEQKRYK